MRGRGEGRGYVAIKTGCLKSIDGKNRIITFLSPSTFRGSLFNVRYSGFSLLEVVFGVMIFMVGMVGVTALLTASIRNNSFSGNLTDANILAASQLETLTSLPDDDPLLIDQDGDGAVGLSDATQATADQTVTGLGRNGMYTAFWNIADNNPINNCKRLTVIIAWGDRGESRQVTVTGYRTAAI